MRLVGLLISLMLVATFKRNKPRPRGKKVQINALNLCRWKYIENIFLYKGWHRFRLERTTNKRNEDQCHDQGLTMNLPQIDGHDTASSSDDDMAPCSLELSGQKQRLGKKRSYPFTKPTTHIVTKAPQVDIKSN